MTETPQSGFPDPTAPPPGAFPAPPPGDPAVPTAAWGTPAPYGEPYAPPPKKKRIWLRVLLGVVGVIVLVIVAGVIFVLVRPKHHLTDKATAAGLQETTPTGLAASVIGGFKGAPQFEKAKHVVTTAYTDGDQQIGVAGADTGDIYTDPKQGIDSLTKSLEGAGATGFTTIDTGTDSARISCGTAPGPFTACVWVDHDTFALVVEQNATPDHLGQITKQLRVDLEAK